MRSIMLQEASRRPRGGGVVALLRNLKGGGGGNSGGSGTPKARTLTRTITVSRASSTAATSAVPPWRVRSGPGG